VLNEGDLLESTGLHFDVAIVDEAGQLTVPAILGALRFARRFILVGDEKQLPPLVLSAEAAEQGLSESLFKILKRLDDDYTNSHPLTMSACVPLRTQYRMNKWIANFSSTVFYDKKLIAHPSVANRRLVYTPAHHASADERRVIATTLEPRFPLVFLDVREYREVPATLEHRGVLAGRTGQAQEEGASTIDANVTAQDLTDTGTGNRKGASPSPTPTAPIRPTGETKQSNAEAQAIREIVAGLQARGVALQDIGIIAPFRAQVANIRRHLFSADAAEHWQPLPADAPISVDTVDRFQGGERMVIIMSFATQHPPPMESPRRDFLTNPHRLNVALTRAQRKLILVGSVPALEGLPVFQRLITYCRSMRTLLDDTSSLLS
jgi:DNA replication ATP-dependent helicase Dna2